MAATLVQFRALKTFDASPYTAEVAALTTRSAKPKNLLDFGARDLHVPKGAGIRDIRKSMEDAREKATEAARAAMASPEAIALANKPVDARQFLMHERAVVEAKVRKNVALKQGIANAADVEISADEELKISVMIRYHYIAYVTVTLEKDATPQTWFCFYRGNTEKGENNTTDLRNFYPVPLDCLPLFHQGIDYAAFIAHDSDVPILTRPFQDPNTQVTGNVSFPLYDIRYIVSKWRATSNGRAFMALVRELNVAAEPEGQQGQQGKKRRRSSGKVDATDNGEESSSEAAPDAAVTDEVENKEEKKDKKEEKKKKKKKAKDEEIKKEAVETKKETVKEETVKEEATETKVKKENIATKKTADNAASDAEEDDKDKDSSSSSSEESSSEPSSSSSSSSSSSEEAPKKEKKNTKKGDSKKHKKDKKSSKDKKKKKHKKKAEEEGKDEKQDKKKKKKQKEKKKKKGTSSSSEEEPPKKSAKTDKKKTPSSKSHETEEEKARRNAKNEKARIRRAKKRAEIEAAKAATAAALAGTPIPLPTVVPLPVITPASVPTNAGAAGPQIASTTATIASTPAPISAIAGSTEVQGASVPTHKPVENNPFADAALAERVFGVKPLASEETTTNCVWTDCVKQSGHRFTPSVRGIDRLMLSILGTQGLPMKIGAHDEKDRCWEKSEWMRWVLTTLSTPNTEIPLQPWLEQASRGATEAPSLGSTDLERIPLVLGRDIFERMMHQVLCTTAATATLRCLHEANTRTGTKGI